jgi:hypothetical protein
MENIFDVEFTAYLALAVILYSIREASGISNRFIPAIAVVLGVAFAWLEAKGVSLDVVVNGVKYGAYGVATVASIKYSLEARKEV